MSSISSAQEPRSRAVSIHVVGRVEVKPCRTLILQEGPNGHLLALLLFRRCIKVSVIVNVESAMHEVTSTTAMRLVQHTHDCDFCLMSALKEPALAHLI